MLASVSSKGDSAIFRVVDIVLVLLVVLVVGREDIMAAVRT